MSSQLLSSKVVVQEEQPEVKTILGVPTSHAAAVGICERGPIGVATLCTSFAEWRRYFGSDIAEGVAASAARGFFSEGGQVLYQTRTVHYTDVSSPATKTSVAATYNLQTAVAAPSAGILLGYIAEPFALLDGDTLDFSVDGGATDTATFNATAASRTAGNTETYDLADGLTLIVEIDGGAPQTATFNTSEFVDIANATAAEVAAVLAAELTGCSVSVSAGAPVITSDTKGTGSSVNVTGGTANSGGVNRLNFTTGIVNGTGDAVDADAVTVAELKTLIEGDVAGVLVTNNGGYVQVESTSAPGPSNSIQCEATSTADSKLGLGNATYSGSDGAAVDTLQVDGKYDGTYANDVRILISPASNGLTAYFNLSVEDDGVIVETYPNLVMQSTNARYVETIINDEDTGSKLIAVTDLGVVGTALAIRPADSPGTPAVPFGPLAGGMDGLSNAETGLGDIADIDFIGDDAGKTGIRSFDRIQDLGLLFIPDRITPAVQSAMISYCEVTRDLGMFAVLDPPEGLDAASMVTYTQTTAALEGISEFGAIYWPQIQVVNPKPSVFGSAATIVVPPSGYIAGMMARTDGSSVGGVYQPPAGVERGVLFGAVGFETDEVLEEPRRDLIYPHRINPIQKPPGASISVDGSRTLSGDGNFPSVSERRGVIFIEQSIKNGIQFARQSNNDESLRERVARSITAFLILQMRAQAFRSQDPDKAFFVDVSEALNPPSEVFANKLNGRIGLATQKPADFVILSFSQDTRALDEELAIAQVGA